MSKYKNNKNKIKYNNETILWPLPTILNVKTIPASASSTPNIKTIFLPQPNQAINSSEEKIIKNSNNYPLPAHIIKSPISYKIEIEIKIN